MIPAVPPPIEIRDTELPPPPVGTERWMLTRITIHVRGDGALPPLPAHIEPVEARHFVEARAEVVRRLGGWVSIDDVVIERVR